MKIASSLIIGLSLMGFDASGKEGALPKRKRLVVAKDGRTDFKIVVSRAFSPSTRHGAEELRDYVEKMSNVTLPIVTDDMPMGEHEIVLGRSSHLDQLPVAVDWDALGDEGYILQTVGDHLVIAGGALRGNLYGVYGLLEDHLGCRWFTPAIERIPKADPLVIPPLFETQVPALEYREPFVCDCFDGDWCARNRMNSSSGRLEEKHGGKVTYFGFVHTFNSLVPPEEYFEKHPDYFSLIDGKRIKERTQLCCTNDDVVKIVTEEVKKRMREHPEATVFSVSQNDWGNYCQCEKCQALASREGSQMAPVLTLVNKVAEAVAEEFPGKIVDTLAYQWTRKPPRMMRPLPNVVVRLCSIECCFSHPLDACNSEQNQAFVRDLEAWAKMCNRLWVWDYTTSFSHYLVPFPNLRILDDNIRLFVNNNVRGVFEQNVYNTLSGELSPLIGYMMAKFLWNPDYDENLAMDEFLEGVYGQAAGPMRKYIDLLHDKVEKENVHVSIFSFGPSDPFFSVKFLEKADRYWDQAEKKVKKDPELLRRVQIARMCLDYVFLEKARQGDLSGYKMDHKRLRVSPPRGLDVRVNRYLNAVDRSGLTRLTEWQELDKVSYASEVKALALDKDFERLEPVKIGGIERGVGLSIFEGKWDALPDYAVLVPQKEKTVDAIVLPEELEGGEYFGLRFKGVLEVPRKGLYSFILRSNDGSALWVKGEKIVDNDGLHGARTAVGHIGLSKGLYPLQVDFFQEGGGVEFDLTWEGPGLKRQSIEPKLLWHRE